MALTELSVADRHRVVTGRFAELLAGTVDWDAPTPVSEWRVRDIVPHLVDWLPGMVAAASSVRLTAGPSSTDQPAEAWRHLTEQVQSVLDDPASAQIGYRSGLTTEPLPTVLDRFWTADVFMHSWDLAHATGQSIDLDSDWAAELLAGMRAIEPELRASQQFGQHQQLPPDADVVDELIAFIGRDPRWVPAE